MGSRLNYSNVTATLALALALGTGGAFAAQQLIESDDIAKNAVLSKHVDNGQLKSKDLKDNKGVKGIDVADASLGGADIAATAIGTAALADGAVDSAKVADASLGEGDLTTEENFHFVGAAGEPAFGNGVQGDCQWQNFPSTVLSNMAPAGFRKDRSGVVHLSGFMIAGGVTGVGDEECSASDLGEPDDSGEDSIAFTLPPAYRPDKSVLVFANYTGTGVFGVLVTGEDGTTGSGFNLLPGQVYAQVNSGNAQVALDGITFAAADSGHLVKGPAVAGATAISGDNPPDLSSVLGE